VPSGHPAGRGGAVEDDGAVQSNEAFFACSDVDFG
jgi:hypothetical protein